MCASMYTRLYNCTKTYNNNNNIVHTHCACAIKVLYVVETVGGKDAGTIMATLSILDIGPVIFGTTDNLVNYLQQRQLLADNQTCTNCGIPMNLRQKADLSDGQIFRSSTCKTTKSLRVGSFFSKSKLTLQKWMVLIYWWVRDYPVSDAAEYLYCPSR